ncbi:MAG: hypothetical protein JNM99_17090 [Verrucomicrobiaceae bacterium]|nr:hypothetical protein [Verrucomicrobiaceae bacterium]
MSDGEPPAWTVASDVAGAVHLGHPVTNRVIMDRNATAPPFAIIILPCMTLYHFRRDMTKGNAREA